MSDVILYKKQKEQLAKATGKAIDALNGLTVVLAQIGVSPVGPTAGATATDEATKKTKVKKVKGEKAKIEKTARNGSAFAEM